MALLWHLNTVSMPSVVFGTDRIMKRWHTVWSRYSHGLQIEMCVETDQSWDRTILQMNIDLFQNGIVLLDLMESTSYLLPSASNTRFSGWCTKPSRAPTLNRLPCSCVILACSKVGAWDWNFVSQMSPWISSFLLLVNSSHNSILVAPEASHLPQTHTCIMMRLYSLWLKLEIWNFYRHSAECINFTVISWISRGLQICERKYSLKGGIKLFKKMCSNSWDI
jgi:hypothetical protein